ncbi:MAG TPA: EAL domain-containing protein [Noviherbaspirillum sp.]|uniref:bifunctional diguanylate cyclase/phosphodiesterase n=1 Tax=Noviherbaspirillum sp. TaxID=1926288 RepID=UPI002D2C3A1F|nr:EAL domain-containing protein [Noviherbaspirillum sp.]HYD94085.1 EAL domain-containing protein [Noviherbaspirillum sp.]
MRLISNFFTLAAARRRTYEFVSNPAYLARFALLASVYALAVRMSLHFAILPEVVSPLWPPSAIALCGCLLLGWRIAPAIWLGALVGMASLDLPMAARLLIATGSMLEAIVASHLVQRLYRTRTDFIYRETAFRFIGVALASSIISASTGAVGVALWQPLSTPLFAQVWLTWWLGDATGMIVGVPLLLAWNIRNGIRWRPTKTLEIAAFFLLLPAVTQFIFGGSLGTLPMAYLTIPFFLWAAIRFNIPTVNWSTAVVCAVAVWNTVHGNGPFAVASQTVALSLVMIYVSVVGTMGLVLATIVYQRGNAESRLLAERDVREQHVRARTDSLVSDIEARKRIEQELAARERQLADAQQLAQLGSWNWDIASNQIVWSDELYRIFGVRRDSFPVTSQNIWERIADEDRPRLQELVNECMRSGKAFQSEYRINLPDGTQRIVAARGQAMRDSAGHVARMFGTAQDITDAKRAESSLREAEERYRKVVELSPDAILVQQDGVFVYANPAAVRLLKARTMQDIAGRPLFDALHPDYHAAARERIAQLQRGQPVRTVEEKFRGLDGSEIDVEVNASAFLHEGRFASLFIVRDITERKKTAEQMAYLAHYDSLTGLPNRTLFHQRLEHALTIAERPGRSLEILFLDLDRFKSINDKLGHATGDLVLKEAATRLQGILRESDTVARLGGDEFVVLVENVDEPHRGGIIAEKILAAFAPCFLCDAQPLQVSTSIGISSFPTDGTDAGTLLKNADAAMYRAKEMGRNNFCYFSAEMNFQATERLFLESALGRAIELGQLSLHYQPKIDVLTNRISGMEALLRWEHPTLGTVPPQRFIPVAEEIGLIRPIGYWTIRTACEQNKAWQDSSPVRLRVAVNLSPRQLADDTLVDHVEAILDITGLDAQYLEFEVSERAVMANPEKSISVLDRLCDLGVTIAIDGFGVGNSSLAYLKRFPIRAVKIDKSFIQGVPLNHGDAVITKAIINLAHSLECSVIAQGAETQQQFDFLRENECDSIQGFYFSAPMPAGHFSDLIRVQSNLHLH